MHLEVLTVSLALACCLVTGPIGAGEPTSATLIVKLSGFHNAKGKAAVALFDAPQGFPNDSSRAVARAQAEILQGRATVSFEMPPSARYAVAALHDENGNRKLDTNFFGIPSEGYGVSNNVHPTLRAPTFEEAVFSLPTSGRSIAIQIEY